MDAYAPPGWIEIETSFNPLQFILFACTPVIEIDGYRAPRAWGRHAFSLGPGNHSVRVWFPYMFMDTCGMAAAYVPVHPGYSTMVRYEAPFFMTSSGTLRVIGSRPAGGY
jgi:hypothetical protein